MRLDGTWGKKFGVPIFECEVFWKHMYCIEESNILVTCGTFWYPSLQCSDLVPRELCPLSPSLLSIILTVWSSNSNSRKTSLSLIAFLLVECPELGSFWRLASVDQPRQYRLTVAGFDLNWNVLTFNWNKTNLVPLFSQCLHHHSML